MHKRSGAPVLTGALAGGALGGTAGYFAADAFWDDPSRVQRMITSVTGLLIGAAGGTAITSAMLDNDRGIVPKRSEMPPSEVAKATTALKIGMGVHDPYATVPGANVAAGLVRGARKISPVDEEGKVSWLSALTGIGSGAASKIGASHLLEGFQNASDLRAINRASGGQLGNMSFWKNIFATRKGALDAVKGIKVGKQDSDLSKLVNALKGNLGGNKFLRRGGRNKYLKSAELLVALLAGGASMWGTNNATGFNSGLNLFLSKNREYYSK